MTDKQVKSSRFFGKKAILNYVFLSVIVLSVTIFSYQKSKAESEAKKEALKSAFVYEVVMNLEVDGKPVEVTRRSGCNATTYSKAAGEKFSEISATGYSMSKQLPTGEYVFVGSPSPCRFFKKVTDANGNAKYEIPELMQDYLPTIHIADKAPVPDVVEIYWTKRAYDEPKARVKYLSTKVTPMPIGTLLEEKEPDPFEFYFSKGDGPIYFNMGLQYAEMVPELEELIKKHIPDAKEPVALYKEKWFLDFFHGNSKLGTAGYGRRKILPEKIEDTKNYKWVSLVFDEGTDFHADTYHMKPSFEHGEVKVMYRLPHDALKNRVASFYGSKNVNFTLPSGQIHTMKAGDLSLFSWQMVYDPKDKGIYYIGGGYDKTMWLKGKLKKYNDLKYEYRY